MRNTQAMTENPEIPADITAQGPIPNRGMNERAETTPLRANNHPENSANTLPKAVTTLLAFFSGPGNNTSCNTPNVGEHKKPEKNY